MSWLEDKISEKAAKDPTFLERFEEEENLLDIAMAMSDFRVSESLQKKSENLRL